MSAVFWNNMYIHNERSERGQEGENSCVSSTSFKIQGIWKFKTNQTKIVGVKRPRQWDHDDFFFNSARSSAHRDGERAKGRKRWCGYLLSSRPQTLSLSHHSTSIDRRTQWSPGTLALPPFAQNNHKQHQRALSLSISLSLVLLFPPFSQMQMSRYGRRCILSTRFVPVHPPFVQPHCLPTV